VNIVIDKTVRKKKQVEKFCRFPVSETEKCGKSFFGIGPSKYCEEHRKLKYRKFINQHLAAAKKAITPVMEEGNQVIKHKLQQATTYKCKCALEGCEAEFDIIVYPRTYIYPMYCPEHRSEYKRSRFTYQKDKERRNL